MHHSAAGSRPRHRRASMGLGGSKQCPASLAEANGRPSPCSCTRGRPFSRHHSPCRAGRPGRRKRPYRVLTGGGMLLGPGPPPASVDRGRRASRARRQRRRAGSAGCRPTAEQGQRCPAPLRCRLGAAMRPNGELPRTPRRLPGRHWSRSPRRAPLSRNVVMGGGSLHDRDCLTAPTPRAPSTAAEGAVGLSVFCAM